MTNESTYVPVIHTHTKRSRTLTTPESSPVPILRLSPPSYPHSNHYFYFLLPQISCASSRTSNQWNHTMSTLYASFSAKFLRFICVIMNMNNLSLARATGFPGYGYTQQVVYPFSCWFTSGLFPIGGLWKTESWDFCKTHAHWCAPS